jgi:hypothetical protein
MKGRRKTFYISPETDKRLKLAVAQEDDKSRSEIVELALKEYFDKKGISKVPNTVTSKFAVEPNEHAQVKTKRKI